MVTCFIVCLFFFFAKGVSGGPTDGDGLDEVTGTGIPIIAGGLKFMIFMT